MRGRPSPLTFGALGEGPSASSWIPQPLDASLYSRVATDVGPLWIANDEGNMASVMEKTGSWKPHESAVLRSLIRRGCRFLDVGAGAGYLSIMAAQAAVGVQVDAVEPDPVNVAALRVNVWEAGISVLVWPIALNDRDRTLMLRRPEDSRSVSRIERVSVGRAPTGAMAAPAAAGDGIFDGRVFDVVRVAAGGWELEVVAGLRATLARNPAARLMVQFSPRALIERRRDPRESLGQYHAMGYEILTLVGAGLQRLSDGGILEVCASAGAFGQVSLVLSRSGAGSG